MNFGPRLLRLVDDFDAVYAPQVVKRNAKYLEGYQEWLREEEARARAGEPIDPGDAPTLYQEAEPSVTSAYARLVVAYAAARLGNVDVARTLEKAAIATLHLRDHPVHVVVTRAFEARVQQAIANLPIETPLPITVDALLAKLGKLERYHVDCVRQHSVILRAHEPLDPVAGFQRGGDPRGALAPVYLERDPQKRAAALRADWSQPTTDDARPALFDSTLGLLPSLEHDDARGFLTNIAAELHSPPPSGSFPHLDLLAKVLRSAHRLDEMHLAKRATNDLLGRLALDIQPATWREPVTMALHALSGLGMNEEVERLLDAVAAIAPAALASPSASTIPAICLRLDIATFHARWRPSLDAEPRTFEDAFAVLARRPQKGERAFERVDLIRAVARALSHTPLDTALSGLERLIQAAAVIFDQFNTSCYVCLHPLVLVESVALAHVELGRTATAS